MNINLEQAVAEITSAAHRGWLEPHGLNFENDIRGIIMKHRIESPFMDTYRAECRAIRRRYLQNMFIAAVLIVLAFLLGKYS